MLGKALSGELSCMQICLVYQSSRWDGVLDDNFSYFSSKLYVVTPSLNCLLKTIQMRGQNVRFYAELTKIIPSHHQILPLVYGFMYKISKNLVA